PRVAAGLAGGAGVDFEVGGPALIGVQQDAGGVARGEADGGAAAEPVERERGQLAIEAEFHVPVIQEIELRERVDDTRARLADPAPAEAGVVRADGPGADRVAWAKALVLPVAGREQPVGVALEAGGVHIETWRDRAGGEAPCQAAADAGDA